MEVPFNIFLLTKLRGVCVVYETRYRFPVHLHASRNRFRLIFSDRKWMVPVSAYEELGKVKMKLESTEKYFWSKSRVNLSLPLSE